jgi:hypothetical protein
MTSDNMRQRTFRRMLAREAGTDAHAAAVAVAARRLCERFAQQVIPLIGDTGVAAILARSLHLVHRNTPGLAPRGPSERDGPLGMLQQLLEHQEPTVAADAAVTMLATVGELLVSFIGESLTTRLLREAWPDDFAGDTTEETLT